jgi:formate dehydrogenase subunit gamma
MLSDLSNVAKIIDALKHKKGALLPIFHEIQRDVGYIPLDAIDIIAKKLQQTPAEIHGVISFYHQFRSSPPGAHKIQICRAEACQARGCRSLEKYAKEQLGIDYRGTTADKKFSLDSVYCLGNCATGPNVRINDELFGRVNNEKFESLLSVFKTQTEGR